MAYTRRTFLGAAAALPAAVEAGWESEVGSQLNETTFDPDHGIEAYAGLGQTAVGDHLPPPDPLHHVLSRTSFGVTRGNLERARLLGQDAYLEEQLNPELIPNLSTEEALLQRYPQLALPRHEVLRWYSMRGTAVAEADLRGQTVMRQMWSERQLYEVMVDFWSNHFNIYTGASGRVRVYKWLDDRDVIRPHAMGNFRNLLTATAASAAMLEYLDNARSKVGAYNENYARELIELHTLGLGEHNQISAEEWERSIREIARCFTGWTTDIRYRFGDIDRDGDQETLGTGDFYFRPSWHDYGEKQVFERRIGGDNGAPELPYMSYMHKELRPLFENADVGVQDGLAVIDCLINSPETATFIATKLVRRFVADDVSAYGELIERVALAFRGELGGGLVPLRAPGEPVVGDIRAMLRVIFASEEFQVGGSADRKFKRPLEYFSSALRVTDAHLSVKVLPRDKETGLPTGIFKYIPHKVLNYPELMGQLPFNWPTPDGFPDVATHWLLSNGVHQRWLLASDMASGDSWPITVNMDRLRIGATSASELVETLRVRLLGRELLPADERNLRNFVVGRAPDAVSDDEESVWNSVLDDNVLADKAGGLLNLMLASPYFQMR